MALCSHLARYQDPGSTQWLVSPLLALLAVSKISHTTRPSGDDASPRPQRSLGSTLITSETTGLCLRNYTTSVSSRYQKSVRRAVVAQGWRYGIPVCLPLLRTSTGATTRSCSWPLYKSSSYVYPRAARSLARFPRRIKTSHSVAESCSRSPGRPVSLAARVALASRSLPQPSVLRPGLHPSSTAAIGEQGNRRSRFLNLAATDDQL